MRSTALALACVLLLGRTAAAADPSIANHELLQSARLWEARQRGDLARLALEKLVNTRPDSPDALLELGELNLRMADFASADRVLRQLERRFKDSPAERSLRVQYRLATRDRLEWASVQRLAQLGEGEKVRAELARLFPQGAPEGSIAIEYYRLLATSPSGRQQALRGLQQLAAKYPYEARYRTALERLQGSAPPTQAANVNPSSNRRAAQPSSEPQPQSNIDPKVLAIADTWDRRSRAANDAQQLQLASLQLQAATAFRRADFEATIAVAKTLDSQGFAAQAGELLTTASQLAPESTWLFESRVRWLIAHDDASQALALLDARPLSEKWPAETRDALRATALDARARAAIAASKEDSAIADLNEAIRLQPTDPWTRYRLAGLLAHRGERDQARRVMEQGAALAPDNPQMRFAQGLHYESTDEPAQTLAAIESVPAENRDADMNSLRDRAQLTLIRQMIESGDTVQARAQLAAVRARANPADFGVQLNIAYREASLGNDQAAAEIAESLARLEPKRADVAMLAARAHRSQRRFDAARDFFQQAELFGDDETVLAARQSREQIENRLHNWMSAAAEIRHKPGDDGISRFESITMPSLWHYALDYERRVWVQADAVSVDAGRLPADFDAAAGFGSIRAAGSAAERRFINDEQHGLAIGLGYVTDNFAADIGSTPLGFELPQVVGGFEWRPDLPDVSLSVGVSRRAITSSVLSYAGMRDPISGVRWGGVVQTGPYLDAGIYRERYSIAGALRLSEITGEHVLDNIFAGARAAADWKFYLQPYARASLGMTLNYWSYDHNLQNYTLGSGGYYSPQSYVSVALPLEVLGEYRDWSYHLRAAVSHSESKLDAIAYYPTDPALQSRVGTRNFGDSRGNGTSLSAYAAIERQVSPSWIVGMKLDIDRADYYDPTVFMLYLRHAFSPWTTRIAVPPRPLSPYNN